MLIRDNRGIYTSTLFHVVGGVAHGFTTRRHGDMRRKDNIRRLQDTINGTIQLVKQVHGVKVIHIAHEDRSSVPEGDGIVSTIPVSDIRHRQNQVYVGVLTADCVPVLFYGTGLKMAGIAHAGWRGTISGITKHVIKMMTRLGEDPKNIHAVLGPYIHSCCYEVPFGRAQKFLETYRQNKSIVHNKNNHWFLDLGQAIVPELLSAGLIREHIDFSSICTSCCNDEFFSYRKDSDSTFGEMVSYIGNKPE